MRSRAKRTATSGICASRRRYLERATPTVQSQALIARLDKLLIRAYGLTEEPLLEQMRTVRTGSAHEIAT